MQTNMYKENLYFTCYYEVELEYLPCIDLFYFFSNFTSSINLT